MSFASTGDSRRKNNDALLKKKRYFDFHQDIIQKHFLKGSNKRNDRKKLTAKQIQQIRLGLILDERAESGRKTIVIIVSFIITLIILYLIVYIFTKYVF